MGWVDHKPWEHSGKREVVAPVKRKQVWCHRCFENVINRVAPGISELNGRYICQFCELKETALIDTFGLTKHVQLGKGRYMENASAVRELLRRSGFQKQRITGSHEIWKCEVTGRLTTLVRSRGSKIDRNRVRAIQRQIVKIRDGTAPLNRHT